MKTSKCIGCNGWGEIEEELCEYCGGEKKLPVIEQKAKIPPYDEYEDMQEM